MVHRRKEMQPQTRTKSTRIFTGINYNFSIECVILFYFDLLLNHIYRVRKLSRATEKLSKTMLNGVGVVSGSVMAPIVKSKPGKAFFSMVPGEVLLASVDALSKSNY